MTDSLTLHEALQTAARAVATRLDLPLGWEGETFTPPITAHLRATIAIDETRAASCGSHGLTHTDGALSITVVTAAGHGDTGAAVLAAKVVACFPRGMSLDCAGGEAVFATPQTGSVQTGKGRLKLLVRLPFYALTPSPSTSNQQGA